MRPRHLLVRRPLVALAAAAAVLTAGCGTSLSGGRLDAARDGGRVSGTRAAGAAAAPADGAVSGGALDGAPAAAGDPLAAGTAPLPGAPPAPADAAGDPGAGDAGPGGPADGPPGAGAAARPGAPTAAGAPAPGAAPAAGAAGPARGAPIVLGTVGTFSGPGGAAWSPGVEGVKLWAADVNRRGGIDGHPVKLVINDDGGDPSRHLSIVKDDVESKGVLAFVYNVLSTTYSKAVDDYLTKKGVPVVGGDASSAEWETSKMLFPSGTTFSAALYSHMRAAKAVHPGLTKIGVLTCREAKGCTDASTGWPAAAKRVGFTTVYNGQASIAQPDYTAECLNARNGGAQMLFVAVDPNSVRRLASSCARQNYKPVYVLPSGVIASSQDGDANLEGALGINYAMPWMSSASPGQQEFQAAVRAISPQLVRNTTTTFGWAAGKVFERAATGRLGPSVSRAGLLAGLYTFKGETLDGVAPPLTFSPGRKSASCWFTLEFKGRKWTQGGGGRAGCP